MDFVIQLGGGQQGFARELRVLRLGGDALVLGRGTRRLAVFAIDVGQLLGGLGVEFVIGMRAAEFLEDTSYNFV